MIVKKKLLYITYDGLTDPLGQSQIIPYLLGISFAGYDVTVISCEKKKNYKRRKSTVKKILKLSNICWKKTFYHKKPPLLSSIWNIYRLTSLAKTLHSKNNFDLVHCRSILSAWIGKSLQDNQTKLIFDIRGFWADERVEGGLWNINKKLFRFIYSYFKELEHKLYEQSDHIITLTQKAKDFLLLKYPKKKESHISVIPCSVELLVFDPSKINEQRIKEKKKLLGILETDFVLGYMGSLGTRYLADEMLEFFSVLKKSFPQSKFLILSNGGEADLLSKAKKLDLEHSVILYKAEFHEMPLMISIMHAAVYFIKAGVSGIAVSPTKQSEILAMGKPIVTNRGIGDSDDILTKSKSGVVLEDFSEESFQKAIKQLQGLLNQKPEIFRKVAEEHFSVESAVEKYVSVYKQLA